MDRSAHRSAIQIGPDVEAGPSKKKRSDRWSESYLGALHQRLPGGVRGRDKPHVDQRRPDWRAHMLGLVHNLELVRRENRGERIAIREARGKKRYEQQRSQDRVTDYRPPPAQERAHGKTVVVQHAVNRRTVQSSLGF